MAVLVRQKKMSFRPVVWGNTFARCDGNMAIALLMILGLTTPVLGTTLYVSNGTHILEYNKLNKNIGVVVSQEAGRIVGLAVDVRRGLLFWSDISQEHSGIYKSPLNGSSRAVIIPDVGEVNGISVDWISNHLYWTDAQRRTIEIANYDGSGRRILVWTELQQPRGIVVDPILGFVFWTDQGTKRVERSWLDGSHRKTIVSSKLYWPNQLAVNQAFRKLYWVDAKEYAIMSCDVNGGHLEKERDLVEITGRTPGFGLVVIGNTAFISTWFSTGLFSMLVETKASVWQKELSGLGMRELFSLVALNLSLQTPGKHPCGQEGRGGCSHMCLPKRGTGLRCACPTFGGLALGNDGQNCEVPRELLFYTLKDSGRVGFISLEGAPSTDVTLVGTSQHPSAVTYDPVEQMVYWSDVAEHKIYRAHLDGSQLEVFLNSSFGVGIVDGLALDWLSRRLYFTNMGQSAPFLDGAVYSWHRIEVIGLDRRVRQTIVTDTEKPRGLALDLDKGYLYYTDWGTNPKVVRTLLDGSGTITLLDSGLSNPNSIGLKKGRVYVVDSNFDNKTIEPQILVHNTNDGSWEQLNIKRGLLIPMGVAVRGDTLYYTDWQSSESSSGVLREVDMGKRTKTSKVMNGENPTGLFYSPLTRTSGPLDGSCDDHLCSHECFRVPLYELQPFHCMCPDQSSLILSSNGATCARPENFLLFADLNTIKLVSLDRGTEDRVHTVYYGDINSNFVALVYDDSTDTIYWSDQTRKAIYSSPLNNIDPTVVYQGDFFIDGLAIDNERQKLYWTAAAGQNGTGHIAKMNLQRGQLSYSQVITGLSNPRAIALCPERKWIFWTDHRWSKTSASVHRAKANGHHHVTLLSDDLYWPNSLVVHGEQLYIGDGVGKVLVMNVDGTNVKELKFLIGSIYHVFGMSVHGDIMFYSDWFSSNVKMIDMITGTQDVMATDLTRPTAVILYHPANLTVDSLCNTNLNNCSHLCVPLPRTFHCVCPIGSELALDGSTCVRLENPWDLTETFRCQHGCHDFAYCAQLVPTLIYECVCRPGYFGSGLDCTACPIDTYKPFLSNETCLPCPYGMVTQGAMGSTECHCHSQAALTKDGRCAEEMTTAESTTMKPTTEEDLTTTTMVTTTDAPMAKSPKIPSLTTSSSEVTREYWTPSTTPEYILIDWDDVTTGPNRRGQPYFQNCPEGESIIMPVPSYHNRVRLPITWSARNAFGRRLPIKSNYPVKDAEISLQWLANGPKGQQTILFEAEDEWDQKAFCQFKILVEDNEAPIFTYCPHDLVIKTNQVSERVLWPRPECIDNIGIHSMVGTQQPGSEFVRGVTYINYTATDKAGNTAVCNFSVSIVQDQHCNLPAIKNGAFMCGRDSDEVETCYIACEADYVISPLGFFTKAFNCEIVEDMTKLRELMKTQDPCMRKLVPSIIKQEFRLKFRGLCQTEDGELLSELSDAVLQYFETRNLCPRARCMFSNITIQCGVSEKENNRNKRYAEGDIFLVQWNITIDNSTGFTRGQIEATLSNLRLELMKLASRLYLRVNNQDYTAIPGSVESSHIRWLCKHGHMKYGDDCVACPAGTMLNVTSDQCRLCPRDFYQPMGSRTFCEHCKEGHTLEEGALSDKECVAIPLMDQRSFFLIIFACTFGFVFLCGAIVMYLCYQRQQRRLHRNIGYSGRGGKFITPNIYVAPPPIAKKKFIDDEYQFDEYKINNRDFKLDNIKDRDCHIYSNHDYEDIDHGTDVSARTLYQNDLYSSFRSSKKVPPNQRTYYDD